MKMFIKLCVILMVLGFTCGQDKNLHWDLAVVINNQIKLLHSNGTEIETKTHPFSSLKALAYDPIRDQFIVSDVENKNDTIYMVQITKDITVPMIQGLPGDVQIHILDKPGKNPTIERAKLDGTEHEIIVDNLMMTPEGIALDYKAQRLYWADSRVGTVAGRIESITLDGKDRKIIVERNTMQPFGLAVDEDAIYWTDTNNKGLYKFLKGMRPNDTPEKLAEFSEMPMGLVANNNIIKEEPDCRYLEEAIETYKEVERENLDEAYPTPESDESKLKYCLNDGVLVDNYCQCKRGFLGKYCETSTCYNLCLNGDCYFSSIGKPLCRCNRGYLGNRCEKNKCDGYCLNKGECRTSGRNLVACKCPEGFFGDRCEFNEDVCHVYCQDTAKEFFSYTFELCRCGDRMELSLGTNHTAELRASSTTGNDFLSKINDPVIYLSAIILSCVLIIIILVIYIRTIKKRRPRIKKRIIVNKNITPLTYRPQPNTEQCEITIENCCNMNVCETPCFEPRGEDKKKLLTNMEGEDLY